MIPPLQTLGPRICIMGPSNSGKSTLAAAITRRLGSPSIHLDQLCHLPGTDWVMRPNDEFRMLHDAAIQEERWVMDGNYSSLLPQRLQRATGLILLDVRSATSLWRYLRRSWFEKARPGSLEGGRDSVKLEMLWHIAAVTPANRRRYEELLQTLTLPAIALRSPAALNAAYRSWSLQR